MTEQMKALGVIKKACSTVTPRTRLSEQSFKMKGMDDTNLSTL